MNCKKAQSLVTSYINRQLEDKEIEEFVDHIMHCQECHEELEIYFMVHFALQKLDEEQDVSYNIKKMLEDDLEATERRIKGYRIFRICSYAVMMASEILLALALFTRVQLWSSGNIRETFAHQILYGQESEPVPVKSEDLGKGGPAKALESEKKAAGQSAGEMKTNNSKANGEKNERENSTD